jgi:hypothetical protein
MLVGSEFMGADPLEWDSLEGFGLRKIIAKHGWMPVDRDDTMAVLLKPGVPATPGSTLWEKYGRYRFYGDFYDFPDPLRVPAGTPGRCRRVVVVDTKTRTDESGQPTEPRPRGIVTSFGAYVPSA